MRKSYIPFRVWSFRLSYRFSACVHSLDVANNGKFFASGSADQNVTLWKRFLHKSHISFRAHLGQVFSVRISYNNDLLITSSSDKMVKLWDISEETIKTRRRPRFVWCAKGHKNWVYSTDISQDCSMVCSASDDKTVKVWDTLRAEEICNFGDHLGYVRSVMFDPEKLSSVASASTDGVINLWDTRTQRAVQQYSVSNKSESFSIKFHPFGNYMLSSGKNSEICVFDIREGRQLFSVDTDGQNINAVCFSPSGDQFYTAGSDCIVRVWNCDTLCHDNNELTLKHKTGVSIKGDSSSAIKGTDVRCTHWHSKSQKNDRRDKNNINNPLNREAELQEGSLKKSGKVSGLPYKHKMSETNRNIMTPMINRKERGERLQENCTSCQEIITPLSSVDSNFEDCNSTTTSFAKVAPEYIDTPSISLQSNASNVAVLTDSSSLNLTSCNQFVTLKKELDNLDSRLRNNENAVDKLDCALKKWAVK